MYYPGKWKVSKDLLSTIFFTSYVYMLIYNKLLLNSKGSNILGWALMEARDEAKNALPPPLAPPLAPPMGNNMNGDTDMSNLQKPTFIRQPSAPPMDSFGSSMSTTTSSNLPITSSLSTTASSGTVTSPSDQKIDPFSISHLASKHSFGPTVFGPLHTSTITNNGNSNVDLSKSISHIVLSSLPAARDMKGERDRKPVTRMLTDIYQRGLFMHGNANSSVNQTLIPAFRHVVGELNKMDSKDKKRVDMIQHLVEACQDCQQVQARVILRMYSDLTCKTQTLEQQLKYSLVRPKEAALQILISKYHAPDCDQSHNIIGPERQRAHLLSAYVSLIGDEFGLDGVETAKGDRFLNEALAVIRSVHLHGYSSSISSKMLMINGVSSLKQSIMDELTSSLCVKECLTDLIGDINNQSPNADRVIDRACIFSWATANTSLDDDLPHRIFYEDSRAEEYKDLHPK